MPPPRAKPKPCKCIGFQFKDARRLYDVPELDGQDAWVCNRCDGIHHHPQQFPEFSRIAMKRQPIGATGFLSYHGKLSGVHELRFATKSGEQKIILAVQPYDRRPRSMGINPNDILLETWKKLDQATAEIMEPGDAIQLHEQRMMGKAKARAIAEILAIMMPPFFETADDIVREAVQRFKNKDNPEYETPGLGVESLAKYDPMPYANTAPVKSTPPAPAKVEIRLGEKEQAGIKMALESGMFTAQQLAKSYGVSVAVIEAIRTA